MSQSYTYMADAGQSQQMLAPQDLTASANGAQITVSGVLDKARVDLSVGAVSGTSPTLSVAIQSSPDGTTWTTRYTFPTVSSGNQVLSAAIAPGEYDVYWRASATVGGTSPSFYASANFTAVPRN